MAERKLFVVNQTYDPPGGGGGDGYNADMEARVKALEDAMVALQQDVAVIRSNYVTKADLANEISGLRAELHTVAGGIRSELHTVAGSIRGELHKAINDQTWKLVTFTCSFGTALAAAVYFIAKNVH